MRAEFLKVRQIPETMPLTRKRQITSKFPEIRIEREEASFEPNRNYSVSTEGC